MSDTVLHLPVCDKQTPTPTPPPRTRLLRSMRCTDMPSVKSTDLAVLPLCIRTDGSNVWSGGNTYIHIHAETDCSVWYWRILLFFLNLPSFFLYLPFFCALFQYWHPWLIISRWVLPEFNSDLNLSRPPFHRILPSSTSHSTSPIFSPLTSPIISLPQRMSRSHIIQHNVNSAATQNSFLCAPRGMTTTAWDGDGGTGGSPSAWDEKRGETCLQQMG